MNPDVLVVCTGNICRSPAVERLLAARTGLSVRSVGTRAVVGAPVSPPMAELLASSGMATQGFAARQLTEEHLASPALVLACAREHRSAVVELDPGALGRTFTVREFARLAAHLPGDRIAAVKATGGTRARLVALVEAVAEARAAAAIEARDPATDDLEDPIGRPQNVYAEVYTQISSAVATIARVLG